MCFYIDLMPTIVSYNQQALDELKEKLESKLKSELDEMEKRHSTEVDAKKSELEKKHERVSLLVGLLRPYQLHCFVYLGMWTSDPS